MQIGKRDTRTGVAIIAEIGNNHEGRFDVALRLVDEAARAGVDAVKFQTFRTRFFTSNKDPARFARLQKFELAFEQFGELAARARSHGIGFLSTPFDFESARFLVPLVDAFKIASGDNDFYALIAEVVRSGKPLIVSSGLTDLARIRRTVEFVRAEQQRHGSTQELAVLQCVSAYPVPPEEANLRVIPLLADTLGVTPGYSDHTIGVEACLGAVALGARVLEKHFTLDKNFSDFRDHQLSADPAEMQRLVESVRKLEAMLGRADKTVQPSEQANARFARRSIVAARDLVVGTRLTMEDLTWIRPAEGLAPGQEAEVLGHTTKRTFAFGELILLDDLD